jgi:hypothetical protein
MIPFRRLAADFAHYLQKKCEAVDIGKHSASGEYGLDVLVTMLGSSSNVILTKKSKITRRKLLILQNRMKCVGKFCFRYLRIC